MRRVAYKTARSGCSPNKGPRKSHGRCSIAGCARRSRGPGPGGGDIVFASRPQPPKTMIALAVQDHAPFAWVAGDQIYRGNPALRTWLEEEGISYVIAVTCSELVATAVGARLAGELAALVPTDG